MKGKIFLKRWTPTILSSISVIGVVATAVMAVKATPKAIRLIDREIYRRNEDIDKPIANLRPMDMVKVAWQCYIPSAAIGVATIGCIFGSNILNRRNQAHLVSAYALLDQAYKNYREAACSAFGDDADSKIKVEMAKASYVSADGCYIYESNLDQSGEKILFYDSFGLRYFSTTMASVLNAQYHINRNLALRCSVSLNEFFEFLGLSKIIGCDNIGWDINEMISSGFVWLDFDNRHTTMEDGMECYIISSMCDPEPLDF
jgi:hypothetical protein